MYKDFIISARRSGVDKNKSLATIDFTYTSHHNTVEYSWAPTGLHAPASTNVPPKVHELHRDNDLGRRMATDTVHAFYAQPCLQIERKTTRDQEEGAQEVEDVRSCDGLVRELRGLHIAHHVRAPKGNKSSNYIGETSDILQSFFEPLRG